MNKLQKKVNKLGIEFGLKNVILEALDLAKNDKTLNEKELNEILNLKNEVENIK